MKEIILDRSIKFKVKRVKNWCLLELPEVTSEDDIFKACEENNFTHASADDLVRFIETTKYRSKIDVFANMPKLDDRGYKFYPSWNGFRSEFNYVGWSVGGAYKRFLLVFPPNSKKN